MGLLRIGLAVFSLLLLFGCFGSQPEQPLQPPQQQVFEPVVPEFQPEPAKPAAQQPTGMKIYFINVGMGDSTLITADGKALLFDAGPSGSTSAIKRIMASANVENIDVLALSSNAPEHIGGAPAIASAYYVKNVWDNGIRYNDDLTAEVSRVTRTANHASVKYGDTYSLGNSVVTVLNPQSPLSLGSGGVDSMALKVQYGNVCALLFSDSEGGAATGSDMGTVMGGIDSKIISGSVPINCQVIKVGNHGSGNAASFQLLEAAKPTAAVISVGTNAGSKYPEGALIERLRLKNIEPLRTDQSGTIILTTDGKNYRIGTS